VNQKFLYLALNIFSFIVPFAFSFHPKANFSKKWKYAIPAILITALAFIVWDEIFTRMEIWGFNEKYLSGIFIFNLPIEEVLFFFCIPYACVFTYFALNALMVKDYLFRYQKQISIALVGITLILGICFIDKWYTATTSFALGGLLSLQILYLKPTYMGRFYFSFVVLMIPFFIVNGVLTGTALDAPVVWYNHAEIIGIRIGTVPVEDIFYALAMLGSCVTIFETLEASAGSKKNSPLRATEK
jgi:lycopene cyclase domain-containing protein